MSIEHVVVCDQCSGIGPAVKGHNATRRALAEAKRDGWKRERCKGGGYVDFCPRCSEEAAPDEQP